MTDKVKNYISQPVTYQQAGKVYYKIVSLKERKEKELASLVAQQETMTLSGLQSSSTAVQQIASEIAKLQSELTTIKDDDVFTERLNKEVIVIPTETLQSDISITLSQFHQDCKIYFHEV